MKEMVQVILYENGTYEVKDTDPYHATQWFHGYNGTTGLQYEKYNCPKDKWKEYLMKLLSTKYIDRQIQKMQSKIQKLQKQKKMREELKENLVKARVIRSDESEGKINEIFSRD